MKKFANAEIEVVKFNNAVIATSGCTGLTSAPNYASIYGQYLEDECYDQGESFEWFLNYYGVGYNSQINSIATVF